MNVTGGRGEVPIERRRHPRTMVQMLLKGVRLDPEDGEVLDTLRMVDISRGGMGAYVDRAAYPGQKFILCLPISEKSGRRNICATVMRCRQMDDGWRVGLRFDKMAVGEWCGVSGEGVAAA